MEENKLELKITPEVSTEKIESELLEKKSLSEEKLEDSLNYEK